LARIKVPALELKRRFTTEARRGSGERGDGDKKMLRVFKNGGYTIFEKRVTLLREEDGARPYELRTV
jgi:hypothetical protein